MTEKDSGLHIEIEFGKREREREIKLPCLSGNPTDEKGILRSKKHNMLVDTRFF